MRANMIELEEIEDKKEKEEVKEEVKKDKKWIDSIHMLHENEMWLNEQAKRGFILKSFDKRHASFIKASPENIKYKIVILNKDKAENQIKIIEHQGFTFVANHEEYYIFYINARYAHIYPRFNEETIEFVRKWFNKRLFNAVIVWLFVISLFVFIGSIFFVKGLLIEIIVNLPIRSYILLGIVCVITITCGVRECLVLIKSKKSFLEHGEYNAPRSLIRSKIIKIIFVIWFWVSLIFPIYTEFWDYYHVIELSSISEVYESMPIVLIQDIEGQEVLNGKLLEMQNDIDPKYNYARIDSFLMSPKQYSALQDYEGQDSPDGWMRMNYYEVVNEILVKPLAKELVMNGIYEAEKEQIKKVNFTGLDDVYTYQESEVIYVSACKGKQVMFVEYHGEQPVEKILSEMAEVL